MPLHYHTPSTRAVAERLLSALERAYHTPAAHAGELCEAVRTFVSHHKSLGVASEEVVGGLRKMALRGAPLRGYWAAYAALTASMVQWGEALYEQAA